MLNVEQCMKDIGCDNKTAKEFKEADNVKRIKILKNHRCILMDSVHKNQKRVDYVDYIIDKLERSNEE